MLHDLATALRRALRTPLFSLTLIGVLAVGIGATATMVSVLDTLLWRPLAMPKPSELVEITTVGPDGWEQGVPVAAAGRIIHADLPVGTWCAYDRSWSPSRVDGQVLMAGGALMSAGCAEVTRVAPLMGRWFTAAEAPVTGRGQAVAIINERYWRRMFKGAPDVLGRTIQLDDGTVTVIGVLPASFGGFDKDVAADIITPFGVFQPSTNTWLLIGRLRPATSLSALRARVTDMWPEIIRDTSASAAPTKSGQPQLRVQSAAAGNSLLRFLYASSLSSVTALAILLLLLTCINASGLLATKVASHRHEMLVMQALGASGARIIRQVLVEAFVVVSVGCALGIVMAYSGTRAFRTLLPWGNMAWTIEFTPDIRILSGVAGTCFAVTVLIAIVPAWLATRTERAVQGARTMTRRASRWSDAMLIGQLAATVVLLFASGLLVRSFTRLTHVDRGFHRERLLSVRLLPVPGGHKDLDQQQYYPQLFRRFAALPGVESVGFARYFSTINAYLPPESISLVSSTPVETSGAMEYVSPNFFATVGVPILRGRDVAWTDRPDTTKIALVSESLARDLDLHGDIVGQSIDFGSGPSKQRFQVAGVVGNISLGNYRESAVKLVFVPALQLNEATWPTFHIRTSGEPLALVQPVTKIVEAAGREYVQRAARIDDMFSNGLIAERMAAVVSLGAATLGVVLAALGLYALLMHSVTLRTREIGIRLAVGAAPRAVGSLIVRHVLRLLLGGIVVGIPTALMGTTLLRSLLFELSPRDPVTLAEAVLLVIVVGAAASAIPAVRASRVDPAQLLRAE